MTVLSAQPPGSGDSPLSRRIRRPGARVRRLGLFGGGILAAFVAVALYGAAFPGAAPLTQQNVNDSIAQALASQTPGPALSELAFAAVQPSLVLIQTDGAADPSGATGGLGSGVIVDKAGDILTSLHVVADATTIKVTFADGTSSSAQVATREPDKDIAVLQVGQLPATVAPAVLGNPGSLRVGSDVYAVGNPYGLYGSMSAGVISGLDRTFQMPDGGPLLSGLFQIDAAVNPGNSGGPLLNSAGQVIGIVTGLINPTKQDVFIGIGFAVPIDVAGGAAGLPQY
jgi:S1-C subfamily serine protease